VGWLRQARVIVLTTVLASLVTNDACVIILTQPLLDLCTAMSVHAHRRSVGPRLAK
jgi:Na+/H+ antiporter NhaD/arsenite permease-like protein